MFVVQKVLEQHVLQLKQFVKVIHHKKIVNGQLIKNLVFGIIMNVK